jgi:NADPH-dependent 2,4-dienoyl-CoA reductase/sulfur reductase-like enzyme
LKKYDVIVIGAGPAGLACAIEAAQAGANVILIDGNEKAGGQLFKQVHKFFGSSQHEAGVRGFDIGMKLLAQTNKSGVKVLLNTAAFGIFDKRTVGVIKDSQIEMVRGEKILLATGAIESPVVFPGWTLPGVMGAGAAQTMINVHRVLPGQKFLVLGSGNVGLIISYQLLQAGAEVLAVLEVAPKIGGYQVHASKIRRAGVPIFTSTTIKEAKGDREVREVITIRVDNSWKPEEGTENVLRADSVCLATGLQPSIKLAQMAGCTIAYFPDLGGFLPIHNENMETTVEGIYVAGDTSGIEEASIAMEEGQLAGIDMAQKLGYLSEGEAVEKKGIIKQDLLALRSGPFGESRQRAKSLMIQKFSEGRNA